MIISSSDTQATVKRDLPHQNVMQSNTAVIVEQMNYDDVLPHLLTYYILSYPEHNNLESEKPQNKKLYVIEKVHKGTEETFKNFLKALQEAKDDSNNKLMIYLQQAYDEGGQSTPLCQSEMLNTLNSSTETELVFGGDTPIQSPVTCINNFEPSSYNPVHNGLPHHYTTVQQIPTASPNIHTSPLSINNALDLQDNSWVIVHAQTNNVTYYKNLVLLMEYISDKLKEALEGTRCVRQIHRSISVPVKVVKAIYLPANPIRATDVTRAADDQVRELYKTLMDILKQLQEPGYPDINIDLNPILRRIGYSPEIVMLGDCNMESLILAIEKLKQATNLCVIL